MSAKNKHPTKKPRPIKPREGKSAPKKKKNPKEVAVVFSGEDEDGKTEPRKNKEEKTSKKSRSISFFDFSHPHE